jgi:hypothetical protein
LCIEHGPGLVDVRGGTGGALIDPAHVLRWGALHSRSCTNAGWWGKMSVAGAAQAWACLQVLVVAWLRGAGCGVRQGLHATG